MMKSPQGFSPLFKFKLLPLVIALFMLYNGDVKAQYYPPYELTVYDSTITGYYFLSSKKIGLNPEPGYSPYTNILNSKGETVYYHATIPYSAAADFKIQPNGMITYYRNNKWMILDSTFTIVDSVRCEGIRTDGHDIQMLPNNHYLLFGLEDSIMDLSSYPYFNNNGSPGSTAAIVTGSVIQELDSNKNMVFKWRALTHLQFNSVDSFWMKSGDTVDWTHTNTVEMDNDGNILISSRHLNEITKIDRNTGDIIWRLGGKYNEFTFVNDPYIFRGQHDIRRLENGNISLFDNANHYIPHGARGCEYQLDEVNKIATLVWSYAYDTALYSKATGNCQRVSDKRTLINIGHRAFGNLGFVFVDSMNNKISELNFIEGTNSYRIYFYDSLPWSFNRPNLVCDMQDTVLYLTTPVAYSSYRWSTGATTSSIQITTPGDYYVYVNYGEGFIKSEIFNVSDLNMQCPPLLKVDFSVSDNSICNNSFVTFTDESTTNPTIWQWSFPGGTPSSSNLQNPQVQYKVAGVYAVTLVAGDSIVNTTVVKTNYITVKTSSASNITPNGSTNFCPGGSVLLSANTGNGLSYKWLKGGNYISGATANSYLASIAGSYKVEVTNQNGCSRLSSSIQVALNSLPPATITANGPISFCTGESVLLSANIGTGLTYKWLKGGNYISGVTADTCVAATPGYYKAEITNQNGCSKISNLIQVSNYPLPISIITPAAGLTFCEGDSVLLQGNVNVNYLWSDGTTTQNIYAKDSGTYQLTVTNQYGCSAQSANVLTNVNALPAVQISANGSLSFCEGGSVQLDANSAAGYLWSTAETTSGITVNSSGNYSVLITDSNGCKASSNSFQITVFPLPANNVTLSGPTTFCEGGSIVLTADSSLAYYWSNGVTDQSATITQSGSYSVIIENGEGCSAVSEIINVNILPAPNATITPSGNTSFCENQSVVLSASNGTSYLWSTGETTQQITTDAEDTFYVTVTDSNGCSAQSAALVTTIHPLPVANITAAGSTTFCSGSSVMLISDSTGYYQWSNGATTNSTIINSTGDYFVVVTSENGCTATSDSISVTVNQNPAPVISSSGSTTFCDGNSVTLSSSPALNYLWSNGDTNSSVVVSASGTYYVLATDTNGCSGQSSDITVTVNPNPVVQISANGPLSFCTGGIVVLTCDSAASYLWSDGATTQSITVSTSGAFYVTATNTSGCSAQSGNINTIVNAGPVASISPDGPTSFCEGGNVKLTSALATSYLWSNGKTTRTVTIKSYGIYTVIISNASGCTASASININVFSNPLPGIVANGPISFCTGGSVLLSADTGVGLSYKWLTGSTYISGATSNSYLASTAGYYKVEVTNQFGCSRVSNVIHVTISQPPTSIITANGPVSFCSGGSVLLSANTGTGLTYKWRKGLNYISGATADSLLILTTGNYKVEITNQYGCSKLSNNIYVIEYPLPSVSITALGSTTFCAGDSVELLANSGIGLTYQWKKANININGATSQNYFATSSGIYKVIVTNLNSCSRTSASKTVTVNCRLAEKDIEVFPNPTDANVAIQFNSNQIQEIEIYLFDAVSKQIYYKQLMVPVGVIDHKIDMSNLAAGFYLFEVRSNDELIKTGKILKE